MFSKEEVDKVSGSLNSKKKFLIYHLDADGSCSAAQFMKFFEFTPIAVKDPYPEDELLKRLIGEKPQTILFLDLSVDQHWEKMVYLKKSLPKTKIIVLDHHIIHKDLNQFDIIHFNPRFSVADAYIPTSLMAFYFLEKLGLDAEKGSRWVACVGMLGDYGHIYNKEFTEASKKKLPGLLTGKDLLDSKLGEASKTIYSAIIYKGGVGAKKVLDALVSAGGFKEFEKDAELASWRKDVDAEIQKVVGEFSGKKDDRDQIIFFEVVSSLNIASIIANIIARKNPDKVVVIAKGVGNGRKVSVRAPETINVNGKKIEINLSNIVGKAAEGIGHGGGHERAAGAFVKDWEEFKKRMEKAVKGG